MIIQVLNPSKKTSATLHFLQKATNVEYIEL